MRNANDLRMLTRPGNPAFNPRAVAMSSTIALGFLLLPIIAMGPARAFNLTVGTFCAWLVIGYSTIRLTVLGLKGEKRLISMTFWVFAYTLFGFVPLVQLTATQDSFARLYHRDLLATTYLVILLGMLAFDAGSASIRLRSLSFLLARIFRENMVNGVRSTILAVLALASAPLLINQFGGFAQLFLSRAERFRTLAEATNGYDSQAQLQVVNALITTPTFVAFLASLALYMYNRRNGRPTRVGHLVLIVSLGLATLIINNPISTARFLVGTIILSLAFYLIPWRRNSFSVTAFAITLLFIVVFPFADLFRNSLEVELSGVLQETTFEQQIVKKGDYDGFEQVINSVEYVDRHGLGLGNHLLGTALFWLPRNVWASKPVPSGQLIAEFRGTENLNLSLPLWGEFYLDGHLAAVILGFLLYGSFVGAVETQYARTHTERPNFATLFVPVYSGYQFFLLRGSLLSATAYLAPIVVCMLFCTARTREPATHSLITKSQTGLRSARENSAA